MTLYQKIKEAAETKVGIAKAMLDILLEDAGEEVSDGLMMNIIRKHIDSKESEIYGLEDLPELDEKQKDQYEVLAIESLLLQNLMPEEWDEEKAKNYLSDKTDVCEAASMGEAITAAIKHFDGCPVNVSIVAKVTREIWQTSIFRNTHDFA